MWIGIALASFFAFVLLILSVPIDLSVSVTVGTRIQMRTKISWLFGLIEKDIKKSQRKEKFNKPRHRKSGQSRFRVRRLIKLFRIRGITQRIRVFFTDILKRTEIRILEADVIVGFENPADTGLMFALVAPAAAFIPSRDCKISIAPSFESRGVLEGSIWAMLRLQPVRFIIPFFKFLFSLSTLRALKAVAFG